MDEWEIDKPLGQCYGTGKRIGCGEEYFDTLVETNFCEELALKMG